MEPDVDGRARAGIVAALRRVLVRGRARQPDGDNERAAGATKALIGFALFLTVVYVIVAAASDAPGRGEVVAVNAGAGLVYMALYLAARRGAARAAAIGMMAMGISHALAMTVMIGPAGGLHLLLLAVPQLAFMVFTDQLVVARWLSIAAAALGFVSAEFVLDQAAAPYTLSDTATSVLFSLNAAGLGFLLIVLTALSHVYAGDAQAEARAFALQAEFLANTDPLTGLANRRPVMEELAGIARAGETEFSVAIADLDNFKSLNDAFGHTCGDNVLADLGRVFNDGLRSEDTVGRWGGEEFVFVLPQTSLADAAELMDRIRVSVESHVVVCGRHTHSVTASFGVSDGVPESLVHRVIKRADDAMYDAKAAGRNVVRTRSIAADTGQSPTIEMPRVRRGDGADG